MPEVSQPELPLSDLLQQCEDRLMESRRSIDEALLLVRRASKPASISRHDLQDDLVAMLDRHWAQLVESLPADRAGSLTWGDPVGDRALLIRFVSEEEGYRMGRRKLALTETEEQILGQLRLAMPQPVSRARLHAHLYPSGEKASMGAIDVYMSSLRQKLKLAGNGQEYIVSVRGRGWTLNPQNCETGTEGGVL